MTTSRDQEMPDPAAAALLPEPLLLITEPADEFDRICADLNNEIRPHGIVEQIYVDDIARLVWEILRLRRCKASIINLAFRAALEKLAAQFLRHPGQSEYHVKGEAEELAEGWFSKDSAKKKMAQLLTYFHLDKSAIEAEAIRRSAADIELLDKLLASLKSRRDKALRRIAEYRGDLGRQMRNPAERIIEGKAIALDDGSRAKPPEGPDCDN